MGKSKDFGRPLNVSREIGAQALAPVLQPRGGKIDREEFAALIASRVTAGHISAADAAALMAEYDKLR